MRYLIFILITLVAFGAHAQIRYPTGFPTQFNTGYNKWGYAQSDSGLIVANRDTTWLAKYSGTIVFKPSNKKFYWFDSTNLSWNVFASTIDTTSLSNRINLKLNISDTIGAWLAQSTRLVDTMYRVNDSTVGYTIKGTARTFQILGRSSGSGGGIGTVTSVALSMPSAFTVSGSPITSSGTFNVSGAGATTQYIRGNGTLATTDSGMIPNFYLKVRSLFSATSPLSYNSATGGFNIANANTTGAKGAATFTNSDFSDNGSGLISLADIVSSGSCTNCQITFDSKGRATLYSSGTAPTGVAVDTIFRTVGVDSIYFKINGVQYAIKDSTGGGGGGGSVMSVSGTSNRITVTNPTTTPVVDIAATYVGQTSITTLGTIATGAWNGTAIGATFGGTGQTTVTTGDLLYGSASNTWSKLADVATGNALISGGVSTAPSWGKIGLTTHVSGVLPIANGGTGTSSPGLVNGNNISISGSWPNQTINVSVTDSTASLGGGIVYRDAATGLLKITAPSAAVTPSLDQVLNVGYIASNSDMILNRYTGGQGKIELSNFDTTADNDVARLNILSQRGKAVVCTVAPDSSDNEHQYFFRYRVPGTWKLTDSIAVKNWIIGTVGARPDNPTSLWKGFRIVNVLHGLSVINIDTLGRIGLNQITAPKAWLDVPAGGVYAGLRLEPDAGTPSSGNAGDIHNIGTGDQLTFTGMAGTVYNIINQPGNLADGTFSGGGPYTFNPSLTFVSNTLAGIGYNGITAQMVLASNSGTSGSFTTFNSNTSGLSGAEIRDNGFLLRGIWGVVNGVTGSYRIEANTGTSLDLSANGIGNTPDFSVTSGNRIYVKGLDTDNSPPSTSGTTKMVITDANAQLSFADIPSGGTTLYSGDGTLAGNRTVTLGSSNLTFNASSSGDLAFTLGSDATGDIFYRNSSGFITRLGIGSTGNVLTVSGGLPSWAASSSGITTLNTLTASTQTFATGTSGSDFNISSSTSTHTFNIPDASSSNRGAVTPSSQTFGGQKTFNNGIIVTTTANARVRINGNISTSAAPGIAGIGIAVESMTFTNTEAATTENQGQNFNLFDSPILTSGNAISYTGAVSNVRFVGAPIPAGSTTIAHPYDIYALDANYFQTIVLGLNEQNSSSTLGNGSNVVYTGSGGDTFTLPALSTHPGKTYLIKNAGGGNLTLQRGGSDNLYDTASVTSITIAAGVARIVVAGSSFWYIE